jgi:spore coat-associated protein N
VSLIPTSAPGRLAAAAAVGALGLSLTGAGVYAALSAQATNTTAEAVTSGTLSLTMAANGVGFSQAVSDLAPGDVVNRYVVLTNGNSIAAKDLTLGVVDTVDSKLTTDVTNGLKVSVTKCSVAWVAAAGTCAGTTTPLISGVPLSTLQTTASSLISGTVAAGAHNLQLSLTLPDQTETVLNGAPPAGTIQGLSASLTWTFSETQRAAQTTNS